MEKKIILASASPRRIEILKSNGVDAEIIPADVDESLPENTPPRMACMYNALKKALHVEKNVSGGIIIAADTIVYSDRILGKPADDEEAFEVLSSLRGGTHQVMTGVAVIDAGRNDRRVFCECTSVTFEEYSDDDIRAYIATGEHADKAGSYAIQGGWSVHVTEVKGDYYNVIGLPWERLRQELLDLGADV